MDVVTMRSRPPALRRPALVAAFQGWNDAGEAASGAASLLSRRLGAQPFAGVDPEEFFDFQATRPTVHTGDGGRREVDWPENRFSWAEVPGAGRHVVVLEGTEPNLRWRTFATGVVELAEHLDVELVVTLGALQVDSPHTRPVPVTGTASDPRLGARLALRPSDYEGPTGITGVLHQTCAAADLAAVSLWAGVPHYLAATPYLAGVHALTERVIALLGADLPLDELAEESLAQREEIGRLVAEDEDLASYVAELETRADEPPDELPAPLVSGDELAAELERFLRDRPPGAGGTGSGPSRGGDQG